VPGIDAQRWRLRAAEVRAEAEQVKHPEAKQTLLEAAAACERIAAAAEAGQRSKRPRRPLRGLGAVLLAGSLAAPSEWGQLIPYAV